MSVPLENSHINDTTPYLSGTGEADTEFEISVDGKSYTGTVQGDGTWTLTVTDILSDGEKTVILKTMDTA
jgi:hypothetical protein